MDRIRICKLYKFGKYICYNFRDINFFPRGYFFARPADLVTQLNFKFKLSYPPLHFLAQNHVV